MSHREPKSEARGSRGRDAIAPLASVTLARLYLEQRQLERARAMLGAVLARNPADLAARALSRRIGPVPTRLTLGADDEHWIVRGVAPSSLARREGLEVVVATFRARTTSAHPSRGEDRQSTFADESERVIRPVRFELPPRTPNHAMADLASADTTTFEVRVTRPVGMTQASVVACLRQVRAAHPAATASDTTRDARILAVTPVLHV